MGFRFASPLYALLFALLPPLLILFWRGQKRHPYHFSSLTLLGAVPASWRQKLHWIDGLIWAAGLSLGILAAMRPQWGTQYTESNQEGIAIVLTIDASRSMAALDFKVKGEREDRLAVTKDVLRDFISKRPSDQIGMVVFGELAFTQCPLTTNRDILNTFIDRLEIGMAGDATAIGDGLGVAVKRLKDAKAKSKVVVLLTDGESNAGRLQPLQAAELAKDLGIKVYTIGVGTNGKVPFPNPTPWGTEMVMAEFKVDEATLTKIAEETGGRYWNATNTEQLQTIYDSINKLEKTEIKVKAFSEYRELYTQFLLPALGLLVMFLWMRLWIFKRWVGV